MTPATCSTDQRRVSINKALWWGPALIVLALVLSGGLIYGATKTASDHYLSTHSNATESESCEKTGKIHIVKIQKNLVTPAQTVARRCDVLAINNYDPVSREMAFGVHDDHVAYDGIFETTLKQNQGFKVTLSKTGTFRFHDHFDDAVVGSFTVLP